LSDHLPLGELAKFAFPPVHAAYYALEVYL
jgi:hypothetical protein